MTILKHNQLIAVLSVVIVMFLVALILVISHSYFNLTEINLLVDNAIERGLEYELIIHNHLTNSYSFRIIE